MKKPKVPTSDADLLAAARKARENAVATYSHFQVGAALRTADGVIITGCNIENATYGLTVCAERVALWKALSEGHHQFTHVAVVTAAATPTPPCGACRQLLWEFGGDLEVILGDLQRETARYRLVDLFPHGFDRDNLKTSEDRGQRTEDRGQRTEDRGQRKN